MPALKVCVLISGSGTNLQALIDARSEGRLDIEIAHVISNDSGARGLDRARRAGIPCSVLEHRRFGLRDQFDRALAVLMDTGRPDLFVFAGFMRIVGDAVIARHRGRMINLHPSLLPLYPGLHTYRRAIEAGDSQHGASIHFLTEKLDGGPVISQLRIPIHPDDDEESLSRRLGPEEHRLLVATVELFHHHKVECREDKVWIDGQAVSAPLTLDPDGSLLLPDLNENCNERHA